MFNQFGGFFYIASAAIVIKGLVGIWLYATAGGISPNHTYHTHLLRPHVLVFDALLVLAVVVWSVVTFRGETAADVKDKTESTTAFSRAVQENLLSNADYDYEMDQFEAEQDFETAFGQALITRARTDSDRMPKEVYQTVLESVWDGKDAALNKVYAELAAAGKRFDPPETAPV
eukprot:COSAG02_NODE_45_length_45811_cov_83.565891_35_plen_174_part_00